MAVARKAAAKKTAAAPMKKIKAPASPAADPAKKIKAAARPAAGPAKKVRTKAVPAAKPAKARKPKLVRDSYTIPKAEYAVLEQLKARAAALGRPAKKSELLRAGLKVLAGLDDAMFLAGVAAVPTMKTGRPVKE